MRSADGCRCSQTGAPGPLSCNIHDMSKSMGSPHLSTETRLQQLNTVTRPAKPKKGL